LPRWRFREQQVIRRCVEGLANSYQGGEIGLARTAHVMAVSEFGQTGTARNLSVEDIQLPGSLPEPLAK